MQLPGECSPSGRRGCYRGRIRCVKIWCYNSSVGSCNWPRCSHDRWWFLENDFQHCSELPKCKASNHVVNCQLSIVKPYAGVQLAAAVLFVGVFPCFPHISGGSAPSDVPRWNWGFIFRLQGKYRLWNLFFKTNLKNKSPKTSMAFWCFWTHHLTAFSSVMAQILMAHILGWLERWFRCMKDKWKYGNRTVGWFRGRWEDVLCGRCFSLSKCIMPASYSF